jgi:hydrogenase nickel incorporation protein HypB
MRAVLFSVTEGEDKPRKYPTIFNTADLAIITKMDLAAAVEFDLAAAQRSVESVRPGLDVLRVSAKTGLGMADWLDLVRALREDFHRDPWAAAIAPLETREDLPTLLEPELKTS